MFKTLSSMKWVIGALFAFFLVGMYWFVSTAFRVWEPPPQGYSKKELLNSRDARFLSIGADQEWNIRSDVFSNYTIPLGENDLSFAIDSSDNLEIKNVKVVVRLERPASLRKAQRLEFTADPSSLPAKKVVVSGKVNVPETGRWELSAFAIINEEAGVRKVKVFDTSN